MVSSSIQVLGTTFSPFVNRVRIALNLKSVNFEFIEEDLSSKSDLLLRSNPVHKKVPVLIHDGKCISESLVIVQYIDENWTGNGYSILPSDPYDRSVSRFWAAYIDGKMIPLMLALTSAQEEEKVALVEKIEEGMGLLEEAFVKCSKGKSYFGGDNIGYIDIVFGSCLGWIKALEKMSGMKLLAEAKTPGLVEWVDKFLSNDVVKNVIPAPEVYIEAIKNMQSVLKKMQAETKTA
ncbi:Glutathione transferase [Heracleum sosnowskyi]|uniref:glutathione transferase n=1 Tax=Heracleum sosnowskyi TaxID=360622 RepID=A0AAD8HE44_9APIA|nr:Glutathione transferase [Heracleum sosnowskyi]